MTLEQLDKIVGPPARNLTGYEWLWSYFTHTAHHRGQAEVYLRVKGISPDVRSSGRPSSFVACRSTDHADRWSARSVYWKFETHISAWGSLAIGLRLSKGPPHEHNCDQSRAPGRPLLRSAHRQEGRSWPSPASSSSATSSAHLLGNLQIYCRRAMANTRSTTTPPSCTIRPTPGCCGRARLFLLVGGGHAHHGLRPALEAEAAKRGPSPTSRRTTCRQSYAARTMMWSGPIVAAFVIFHVLHLTVGAVRAGTARESGRTRPTCAPT